MITDAKWIAAKEDINKENRVYSKEFNIDKKIKKASLSVTALGCYNAYINDEKVGDIVLAPGLTSYAHRLQYQVYDVTEMIEKENKISIEVGPGWMHSKMNSGWHAHRHDPIHDTYDLPYATLAELAIETEDGKEIIYTDDSWSAASGKVLFSDIYDGEIYDATAEEKNLGNAVVFEDIYNGILTEQECEPVREKKRLKPRLFTTPKGERVLDFGQNISGYVEITVNAKKGDRIELTCGEVLDNDGNFYNENYRGADPVYTYICTDGEQTIKPQFTFYGFQYVKIVEAPDDVTADNFTGIAIWSDMERTGDIKTGHSGINQLFSNTIWSQRDNFVDIPTDCPQRDERLGWTGDAQIFAETACYNYNVNLFFDKWLRDVRAEQYESGAIPNTIPDFYGIGKAGGAWGDAMTVLPWTMYQFYADEKLLRENFDSMKRYVDFIGKNTGKKYLWVEGGEGEYQTFGDWLALDAKPGDYKGATRDEFVASAYYAYSTELLIKAGKALGEDMSEYEELYANIRKTFIETYDTYKSQTEHIVALHFNLTDNREETAKGLVKMVRENNNFIATGFVGTPYILYALSESGYTDVAYDLLLQENYPSWLYEVNHGATTIWEHWDGIRDDGTFWSTDMNSYNHYAFGAVIGWIYRVAAGIKQEKAGFESVIIEPKPDKRLGWIDVSYKTKYGTIKSKWKYTDDGVKYEISTPVSAKIVIDGKTYEVKEGEYVFWGKERH